MDEDDLRHAVKRILGAAPDAGADPVTHRVLTALRVRRRWRVFLTAAIATLFVVVAGLILAVGHEVAARALPPLGAESGLGALLWLPLIVGAGLVVLLLWQALEALVENRA